MESDGRTIDRCQGAKPNGVMVATKMNPIDISEAINFRYNGKKRERERERKKQSVKLYRKIKV